MGRSVNRRDVLKGVGAAGVVGLAGCSGGGDGGDGGGGTTTTTEGQMTTTSGTTQGTSQGTTMSGRTLKMGVLMGVTGGLASLGPPIKNGAMLPVNQINEADIAFDVDTQFEDTGTDPTQGISGAQAILNAGYPMVCGALSSTVTIQSAKQVFIPNGVVLCSPASTSPAITDMQDNDYLFRTPPTDALQGGVMAKVAKERVKASSAATLYVNNDYGQLLSDSFASAFDGTVQQQVGFPKGASSYSSELETALSGDPDMLVVIGYPESGVQIFRDFYQSYSAKLPVLVTDGLRDKTLPGKVGHDMSNVTGTAPLSAGPGKDFVTKLFSDTYGGSGNVYTEYAYDAAAVLLLANAAAGENNGASIRDKMRAVANPGGSTVTPADLTDGIELAAQGEEIQYKGASSAVDFDDNGDMKAVTYEYFKYTSAGELTTVSQIEFTK